MHQPASYSPVARWSHWGIAFVIITAWLIGFYSGHFVHYQVRGGPALYVHKCIASLVIFLVLVRLGYRLTHRYPALPADVSTLSARAAVAVHTLLYVVAMIALPLSGWWWSSVTGHPIPLLGLIDLPPIAPRHEGLYDTGLWIHRALAWTAGTLVLLHVLAALKHHFVDKDNILSRMLSSRNDIEAAFDLRRTKADQDGG
jgi:cytochrome b561